MNYRKKAILMVVALFCLNIAMLAQAVSLKMNNVSVKEAMTQLKNKSGYSFVYKVGDLDTRKIVSVKAKQLNEAIDQILYGQEVVYEVKGKNIIVQKGQARQNTSKDTKKRKVTGTVSDANGEPIIGATIKEKEQPTEPHLIWMLSSLWKCHRELYWKSPISVIRHRK